MAKDTLHAGGECSEGCEKAAGTFVIPDEGVKAEVQKIIKPTEGSGAAVNTPVIFTDWAAI